MPDARSVKEVFGEAVELPVAARAEYLERACAGDSALRAEVEALLHVHALGSEFLSDTERDAVRSASSFEDLGSVIGPYRLLEVLGEGGFGVVFLAEQREPVVRRVALKVIKLGMDTRQVIARFEAERQALARMEHPNIARVLDAGATASGRPYFVMERVHGQPITRYCDELELSVAERLAVFRQVCLAVEHAHQKGVIHRDLKPTNVLVSTQDGRPIAKVIDFGIAKATAAQFGGSSLFTDRHQLIGTPEYMSPEQAAGSLDIDTRSDVYALGVLLYQMLTGFTPFDAQRLQASALAEILRILREEEPVRPSVRISTAHALSMLAKQRGIAPRRLCLLLRGDLDWITLRCLEKERSRRYATAGDLAADVQRHLDGQPVVAAPAGTWYRLRKFVARHRTGVLAGSLLAVSLLLGFAGTLRAAWWALRERDRAQSQLDKAEKVAEFMQQTLAAVGPSVARGRDVAMLREMLDQAAERITRRELEGAPEAELTLRLSIGSSYYELAAFEAAEDMLAPALELARKLDGPQSLRVAAALGLIGVLLEERGEAELALESLRTSLEMYRRLDPGDRPLTAAAQQHFALCLETLGRHADALVEYGNALAMYERIYPDGSADVATCLESLAGCLTSLDRAEDALPKFETVLEMRKRFLPDDHPEHATSISNLGTCLDRLDRTEEALEKFRLAQEIVRRVHSPEHPAMAMCRFNEGFCLARLGRPAEALPCFENALEIWQRHFPGDHGDVATCMSALASCLDDLGQFEEAARYLEEALPMLRRVAPGDHSDSVNILENAAKNADRRGHPDEALRLFEEEHEMLKRLDPGGSNRLAQSFNDMAYCMNRLGRAPEALPLYAEAVAMYREHLEGDRPDFAQVLRNLAAAEKQAGDMAASEQHHLEALEMNRRVYQGDHWSIAENLHDLARVRQARGLPCTDTYSESLEMCRRIFVEPDPQTALVLHHFAEAEELAGRHAEAEPLALEAVDLYREHPDWSFNEQQHATTVWISVLVGAQRVAEAADAVRDWVELLRRRNPADDLGVASALAQNCATFLSLGQPEAAAAAEPLLRECLELRSRLFPDGHPQGWLRFNTMSMLGEALALQSTGSAEDRLNRLREAEQLLLDGHEGLADDPAVPRPEALGGVDRKRQALQRVADLYRAWEQLEPGAERAAQAAEWRARLDAGPRER